MARHHQCEHHHRYHYRRVTPWPSSVEGITGIEQHREQQEQGQQEEAGTLALPLAGERGNPLRPRARRHPPADGDPHHRHREFHDGVSLRGVQQVSRGEGSELLGPEGVGDGLGRVLQ